jgi:hypothetical protein
LPDRSRWPYGIRYAFTLHDANGTRLLDFDNAHGVPRAQAYDHWHRFRRMAELVPYDIRGADELICDFFAAVEQACLQEDVPFEFETEAVGLPPCWTFHPDRDCTAFAARLSEPFQRHRLDQRSCICSGN